MPLTRKKASRGVVLDQRALQPGNHVRVEEGLAILNFISVGGAVYEPPISGGTGQLIGNRLPFLVVTDKPHVFYVWKSSGDQLCGLTVIASAVGR